MWKSPPGFTGYAVSDAGEVRSPYGKLLTPSPHEYGHLYVWMKRDDGQWKNIGVHRVVLLTFVGPPPLDRPNALHKNDVPADNHLENLYWGSHSENNYDSVANGNHVQARKRICSLGHCLVAPNLVASTVARGGRECQACKLAKANHNHDERLRAQGKARSRYNCGRDGFQRRAGESFEEEAHRRYRHIMGQDGAA